MLDSMQTTLNTASGHFDQSGDNLILWGTIDEPATPEQDKQCKYVFRGFALSRWPLQLPAHAWATRVAVKGGHLILDSTWWTNSQQGVTARREGGGAVDRRVALEAEQGRAHDLVHRRMGGQRVGFQRLALRAAKLLGNLLQRLFALVELRFATLQCASLFFGGGAN